MEAKVERILTVAVVAIVAALMVAMVIVFVMTDNGSIDGDTSTMVLVFLSMTLSTVVVVFGVVVMGNSRKDEYRKYFEERDRQEREKRE